MKHPGTMAAIILGACAIVCVALWACATRYQGGGRPWVVDRWTGQWRFITDDSPRPTPKKTAMELIQEVESEPVAPLKP